MLGSLLAQIDKSWLPLFAKHKSELTKIQGIITPQRIAPTYENVLRVFNYPISHYRAVIVGQDPYPTPGNAMGLAFSVNPHVSKIPPSLNNIFAELESDQGVSIPATGDLSPWMNSGVLLLNRVLTTRVGESNAHTRLGWQKITDHIARELGKRNVVAILWGQQAQELSGYFSLKVEGVHPSPLSAYRGFFGSRPFSQVNDLLASTGRAPIDWSL